MTAFGGFALPEMPARRTRPWSDCGKLLPERRKGEGGYFSVAVASAVIHGRRSGGGDRKDKEGEAAATLRLIPEVWSEMVQPLGLDACALFLLDSLYGDGPCLDALEAREGAAHVVGANKIPKVAETAAEQPESRWLSKGANAKRGWSESPRRSPAPTPDPFLQKPPKAAWTSL